MIDHSAAGILYDDLNFFFFSWLVDFLFRPYPKSFLNLLRKLKVTLFVFTIFFFSSGKIFYYIRVKNKMNSFFFFPRFSVPIVK